MCSEMYGTALMYMYCSVSRFGSGRVGAFELLLFFDREALVGAALEVVELRSC